MCRVAAHPQLVIPTGSKSSSSLPRVLQKKLMIRDETQQCNLEGCTFTLCHQVFQDVAQSTPSSSSMSSFTRAQLCPQQSVSPLMQPLNKSIIRIRLPGSPFHSIFIKKHFLSIYSVPRPGQDCVVTIPVFKELTVFQGLIDLQLLSKYQKKKKISYNLHTIKFSYVHSFQSVDKCIAI